MRIRNGEASARRASRGFGIGLVIAILVQGEKAGNHLASFMSRQLVISAVVQMLLFGLVARPLLVRLLSALDAGRHT